MGVGGNATPRPLYLRESPGTHCKEAGWAPGPLLRVRKISPPLGTIQPVASRYTGNTIPAHELWGYL